MAIGSFIQSNTQEGAFTAVNSSAATMVDKEGYFVTPTGNMVTLEAQSGGKYMEMVLVSGVTDDPIYLLQAGAAASKPIEVLPLSPHRNLRCVAGGTITANELLTVHSDGTAVSAVNGSTIIGYAEEDAAAGGYVKFRPVSPGLVNSTATAWYDGATTTLADDHTFVTGTTKGLKIGGAANQKVGFYNAKPVVQAANTADIKDTLVALGFFADGTHATPLNLDGGALTTSGAASLTGGVTTAGAFKFEVATVAAAGSAQGDAGVIAKTVTYVTAADGTKGVVLPTAAAGLVHIVYNKDANLLKLYPGSSDSINNQSANAAIIVPGWSAAVCVATDATIWAVGMFSEFGGTCNAKLDAVTADGSGQGDGAMADTSQGAFVVASGGDGTKVITLPAASNAAGYQCEIYNNSASNLPVFPATGGAINGGSANAAVTIATYTIARVVCIAANTLAISEQAKA